MRIGLFSLATIGAVGGFALLGGAPAVLIALLVLGVGAALPSTVLVRGVCRARRCRPLGSAADAPTRVLQGQLQRRLDGLAARAGRAAPLLVPVTGADANAFTLATARRDVVLVTEGLIARPAAELDAVLAHELAHLERRDPLLVTSLLAGPAVLTVVAFAAATGDPSLDARLARYGDHAETWPHLALLLGVALAAIGLGLRQRLEWSADARAAVLLNDPRPVASALRARRAQLRPGVDRRAMDVRLARLGADIDRPATNEATEVSSRNGIDDARARVARRRTGTGRRAG